MRFPLRLSASGRWPSVVTKMKFGRRAGGSVIARDVSGASAMAPTRPAPVFRNDLRVSPAIVLHLVCEFEFKICLARIKRRCKTAECGCPHCRSDAVERNLVEDVKHITAEFQRDFPATKLERSVLVQAHVQNAQAGPAQNVAPGISELAQGLRSKGSRVEVPSDVARLDVERSNDIGTARIARSRAVARFRNREWISRRIRGDPAPFPPAQNPTKHALLRFEKRQVVNIVKGKAVRLIQVATGLLVLLLQRVLAYLPA